MAAYQQMPKDWFKLQELRMFYGADIYQITLAEEDTSRKGDDAANSVVRVYIVGFAGIFMEEKFKIGSELTLYLNYLLEDYETESPNNPGESQRSLKDDDCDVRLPAKVLSERRAAFEALPSVPSSEKEMVQRLNDAIDILEPMEQHRRQWSSDPGKRNLKVISIHRLGSDGRVEDIKDIEPVHNALTAGNKSHKTRKVKARASSKQSLHEEKVSSRSGCSHFRTCMNCDHQEPWLNNMSTAMYSEAWKETVIAKELKTTGHSDYGKKGNAMDKFKAKQNLKTNEESGSNKAAIVTVDGPNVGKGQDSQEVQVSSRRRCKNIGICKISGQQEPCSDTKTNAIYSQARKETDVEKEPKATAVSDCHVKNEDSAVEKKSGRKQTVDVDDGRTTKTEIQGIKSQISSAHNMSNFKNQASTKIKSKVTNSSIGEETDGKKELKAIEEPLSRKKAKVSEEYSARKYVTANMGSSSEKAAKVAVDEPDVEKRKGNQEKKESGKPSRKNVRTCWTCGLQEPAPKVFKKCKRCKDEGCPDPPYYCGRDCQVLDWTVRHRQRHVESFTRDPTTP